MKTILAAVIGGVLGATVMWAANSSNATAEEAEPSKPAYLVVLGDVHDREAFMTDYAGKLGPLYKKYGGEYLAIGQNKDILENGKEFQSFVISKWPSMEAARAFWSDPQYEELKRVRMEGGMSTFDIYLLEGVPEKAE